jgi:hypothetical protein
MKAHEGMRAGLAGGTAVWLWLLVSDTLARVPLKTPAMLGHGLLTIGAPNVHIPTWESVLAFTVAHFAAWIGLGGLMAIAVRAAARTASVLLFALLLTVLVQFLIVGITAIMAKGPLGGMAWRDVLIGNFIGWGTASWYLIRRHKELRAELGSANQADDA